jgi:hypothetical protein
MSNIRSIIRTGIISFSAVILMASFPVMTYADDSSDGSSTSSSSAPCTAPNSSQPGVHVPVGSDAKTFTYQCTGQYTGEWTNQYYVYDPSTNTRTAIYALNYSYDCSTGIWTMDSWDYDAATGKYVDDRVDTSAPAGVPTGCPVTTSQSAGSSTVGSDDSIGGPTADNTSGSSGGNGISTDNDSANQGTGSGGSNTQTNNSNNTIYVNNGTTAVINNNIDGSATSGNSLVIANTSAGDATTGSVQDEQNVINMLQSSSNALGTGSNVITFTDNINGDVNGNLLLDPATLSSVQPASTNSSTTDTDNTLVDNNSNNTTINNNIDVGASSGNAAVSQNTSGGSATSGTAEAIANVVNLMNSAITSGQSFVGTININGDLNGNILIPADLANELLADNVPTVNVTVPDSDNSDTTTNTDNTTVTNTNNEGINNNVDASATSGQAAVTNNTSAGNATSGQATTNLTAFNLTGSSVIGSNDLLVFVNVLGSWVGMIMNAPAGSTAAEIGGGITSNTTNTNTTNTTLNNTNNESINNNITGTANSGDADVSDNTNAGNAASGNADTAVNLANIENSSISLNGWFGILFINVFGTWDGSFGVNPTATSQPGSSNVESVTPAEASSILQHSPVFGFSADTVSSYGGGSTTSGTTTPSTATVTSNAKNITGGTVLADKTVKLPSSQQTSNTDNLSTYGIIGGLVVLFIAADAIVSHRKRISKRSTFN